MTDTAFQKLLEKIEKLKSSGDFDLSLEEDLSIAIMNLISLEEHFFFTGSKTGKSEYFDLLGQVRDMRKSLLARMIDSHEGETWCISKHLLAATMRMIEVGTKYRQNGKTKDAEELFSLAYKSYSLFWALRLKLINTDKVSSVIKADKSMTYTDLITQLVDCCKE